MRPILIATGLVIVSGAALFFYLSGEGPQPVTYAPAPAELAPPQTMGLLAPETTTRATLPAKAIHHWTFAATAGDSITLRLVAQNGSLAILPPDDAFALVEVSIDPATDEAEICDQVLPVTGTYTLQVQGSPAETGEASGSYGIRIERLGPPTDAPLPVVTETQTTDTGIMMSVFSPPCSPA